MLACAVEQVTGLSKAGFGTFCMRVNVEYIKQDTITCMIGLTIAWVKPSAFDITHVHGIGECVNT